MHDWLPALLQRKLLRDLRRLWSQVLTIGLVMASAVGALITTQATVHSLESARATFYENGRMADVFASVRRAPRSALPLVEAIDGVAQVQATLERPLRLLLPGQALPIMGHIVGIDPARPLQLNRVVLRQASGLVEPGLWPGGVRADGTWPVWISEGFAQARGLQTGSRLEAVMNGHLRRLEVTGLALAPDAVFAGAMGMPDPGGYAVLWIDEQALAAAWGLQGQWTRLALRLAPGATEAAVLKSLDTLLPRWGGREAVPRRLQSSHQMLDNEIQEQRLLGTLLPAVFAGVSVFLLHAVMTRLVATQREPMACLKALGFPGRVLALHQLELALVMAAVGVVVGGALGTSAGAWLMGLYGEFFRFPALPLRIAASAWWLAVGLAATVAVLGVAQAMRELMRLSPAVALQPAVPQAGRHAGRGWRRGSWASATTRLMLRQMARRPWRAVFTVLGMACAMALVVMGNFFRDAIDSIVSRQFEAVWRGDVQVMTVEPVHPAALEAWRRVEGVALVEGSRTVPATLVHGHRTQRVQLRGLEPLESPGQAVESSQQRLVDALGRVLRPLDDALVITDRLARKLGVQVGDEVVLRLPEASLSGLGVPEVRIRVGQLIGETMGLSATTTRQTVNRLMGEGESINVMSLRVRPDELEAMLAATVDMPRVAAAFSKSHLLRNMQAISARNIRIMSSIMTGFALIVAVGVVYNHARVALSERTWELASLRVLGFSQAEVSRLMVGEQALMLAVALPLGMGLGWLLVVALSVGLRSDQFQFPVVVWPRTYAMAALSLVMAALGSSVIIVRRVRGLDLVAALKTRE